MNPSSPSFFGQFMSMGLTSLLLAKCSYLMHKNYLTILVGSIYPDTVGLCLINMLVNLLGID